MPRWCYVGNTTTVKLMLLCFIFPTNSLLLYYFTAGFAFLPFLWAINAVWFFNDVFRKPAFEEQSQMRTCNTTRCLPKSSEISPLPLNYFRCYQIWYRSSDLGGNMCGMDLRVPDKPCFMGRTGGPAFIRHTTRNSLNTVSNHTFTLIIDPTSFPIIFL